jgi:uncharacterized repeat protein (TIGR01451 family)
VFWVDCDPDGGEEGDADVTVSKSASGESIDAGGSFTYTLIVANSGTATAKNVTVTDNTLDLPLIFSAPTASQGTCAIDGANNLTCSLGDIAAGGEVTITFVAETTEEACPRAINRATVAADNDSDTTNNVSNAVTVKVNCEEEPEEDGAALNIRKVDDQGARLAGAVFTVEGMEGTFTTGENGHFCITGLEEDSVWLVTEIQAPDGYEIAEEASQLVEVDNDGDCRSPDAVFVNTLAEEEEPETEPTPKTEPTPREDELGGNPTPTPGTGNTLPDTALVSTGAPISPAVGALVALVSLLVLAGAQLAEARARR